MRHRALLTAAFSFLSSALLSAVIGSSVAQAQAGYPTKPITFVVPFAPGGISDIMARAMGAAMATELGQQVVIVNKPSPGIVLGLSEVAHAKPDGYTIGIWFPSAYSFPLTMKTTVPYDGIDSFSFVMSYTEPVLGVVVRTDAPWKTFQDIIEEGKRAPGKLKFGTVGVNSAQHLIMEIVMKQTGSLFVHVPQSGVAAGIANVLGGHLDFESDASSWAPNVRQGQMRLLAYTGDARSHFFPDVPTFSELGFKVVNGRGAVVGPAGLPESIRQRLETALTNSLKDDKVKEAFAAVATEISPLPGAEMKALMIEDRKVWQKMIVAN